MSHKRWQIILHISMAIQLSIELRSESFSKNDDFVLVLNFKHQISNNTIMY